jgi:hypothetical protein
VKEIAMKMLWIAAILMLLAGCGGGSNTTTTIPDDDSGYATPAQITAAVSAATHSQAQQFDSTLTAAVSAATASDAVAVSALQARLDADEKLIERMELFGHAPGTIATTDRVRTQAVMREPSLQPQATAIGPCPDMGVLVGYNSPDPLKATVAYFKQCTGIEYGVNIGSNDIETAQVLWFTDSDCGHSGGSAIEFENDGFYNRQSLQNRIAFISPVDGMELVVAPNQTGVTMTSESVYFSGACTVATETHIGYLMTANDTASTGVPAVAPSGWVL